MWRCERQETEKRVNALAGHLLDHLRDRWMQLKSLVCDEEGGGAETVSWQSSSSADWATSAWGIRQERCTTENNRRSQWPHSALHSCRSCARRTYRSTPQQRCAKEECEERAVLLSMHEKKQNNGKTLSLCALKLQGR